MNNRTKYCRYKNYLLQVQTETLDNIYVVTSDWETGKNLDLICHDRDHFTKEIPREQIDCIWTVEANGNFYDTIEVEYGIIKVKKFDKQIDLLNSEFIVNGEFAKYKGKIFRSLTGYGHNYWFKLESTDESNQEIGFIMEKPGKFYKCVNPTDIEFAFVSSTYCFYHNKEFCIVDSHINGNILIEPFDRNTYLENELIEMNFEMINTKLSKWILPTMTDKIWTKTKSIHNFERFINNDKILHEK
jgi:hypothetical protein